MRLSSLFGLRLRHRSIQIRTIKNHRKALEKGNQKQPPKQRTLEQIKRDGERIRKSF